MISQPGIIQPNTPYTNRNTHRKDLIVFAVLCTIVCGVCGGACHSRPEPPFRPSPELAPTRQQIETTGSVPTVVQGGVTENTLITPTTQTQLSAQPNAVFNVTRYLSDPSETKVMADFDAKRYTEAAIALSAIADSTPSAEKRRAASLLAGLAELRSGQVANAAGRFVGLVESYPLLADYHKRFAAEAFLGAGDYDSAIRWSREVDSNGPNAAEASLIGAKALAKKKTQDWPAIELILEKHIQKHGRSAEIQLLLADAQAQQSQKLQDAILSYRLILARWPLSPQKDRAMTKLKKLITKLPAKDRAKWEQPNDVESLMRGRKLYDAHRSSDAIAELTKVAATLPKGSDDRCEALTLAARSYDKLRTRKEGHPLYSKARAECARSKWMADILFFGGQSLFRSGKNNEALDYFESLHELFPDVSYNDDALIYEAQIYGEQSSLQKRKQTLERALRDYPEGDMRDEASWLLLWDAYQSGDMDETVRVADRLLQDNPRENLPWSEGRTLYWKARALSRMKQTEGARLHYRKTLEEYPLSYYAHLAYARLVELDGPDEADRMFQEVVFLDPAPTRSVTDNADPALFQQEPFLRGTELIRVGLLQLAVEEFSRLKTDEAENTAWAVAQLYDSANAHNVSHNIARRKYPGFRRHYPKGPHAQKWAIAYPRPYLTEVTKGANEAAIPEGLVYGIMREESGFNPTIESWANAVGLMQLLVPTAQNLVSTAELLPGEKIDRTRLHDPELNVRLGARFLGQLSRRLGHFALAAAGYNAGLGGAQSFLNSRPGLQLDEFVEFIPYRQTRRYVASTMSSFGTYTYLYSQKPLLLSLDVPSPGKVAP
ncbi:MAG: transglycosylase SLT domain-containing protein [Myxococcales bacterium]|nr:transglycosylase SLT domain-containing protein [Myxococcales bacterium]